MQRINSWSMIFSLAGICVLVLLISPEHCDDCYSPNVMALRAAVCGFVLIIGSFYFRNKFKSNEKIIFDVESQPLLETSEASAEVPFAGRGVVQPENGNLLASPYRNVQCVYYHSIKEEYVKQGKHSSWRVVENISRFVPFHIQDERGNINVDLANMDEDFSSYKLDFWGRFVNDPKNSEIDCEKILNKSQERSSSSAKIFGMAFSSGKLFRKTECVLKPGTEVFVYGLAAKAADGQMTLRESERCPLIISRKSRDAYVDEFYKGSSVIYSSHFLISVGYTAVLLSMGYLSRINPVILFPALIAGNGLILGSLFFTAYNRIITVKNRALNALSNIDIELKRRAELIPNLVETVKGYVKQEENIQRFVAEARTKEVFSENIPEKTSPVIGSLSVIIENYPELKASANFQSLMLSLVDAEERIADSREFYNRNVKKYNILINQFPFLLIAGFFAMKPMEYLSISKEEASVPNVSLWAEVLTFFVFSARMAVSH